MPKYNIKCADGTDRQCVKVLKVDIEIINLTTKQLDDISDGEQYIEITKEQVINSYLEIDDEDKKILESTGYLSYQVQIDRICGACGSDYTRDDDGNIID